MTVDQGMTPWHMWGQSKELIATSGGVVTTPSTTGQITKVSYKRPDSFSFLLAAILVGGQGPGGAPVSPGSIAVSFAVTIGVGLSQITLDPFCIPLVFQWNPFKTNIQKWFSTSLSPVLDDSAATPQRLTTDVLVAENIQVSATAILQTPTNGDQVIVQVHSYFAPRTHIRPDWYEDGDGTIFYSERAKAR